MLLIPRQMLYARCACRVGIYFIQSRPAEIIILVDHNLVDSSRDKVCRLPLSRSILPTTTDHHRPPPTKAPSPTTQPARIAARCLRQDAQGISHMSEPRLIQAKRPAKCLWQQQYMSPTRQYNVWSVCICGSLHLEGGRADFYGSMPRPERRHSHLNHAPRPHRRRTYSNNLGVSSHHLLTSHSAKITIQQSPILGLGLDLGSIDLCFAISCSGTGRVARVQPLLPRHAASLHLPYHQWMMHNVSRHSQHPRTKTDCVSRPDPAGSRSFLEALLHHGQRI